ncbi:45451_t:CDS:10, partial [Gigaspora margarita]
MSLLCDIQDENNQNYVESNNFESRKNAIEEIFDENSELLESEYEYDNEQDNEYNNEKDSENYIDEYANEYNNEYNEEGDEEYSEKHDEEYSEKYNEEDIDKEFNKNLFKGLQLFQIKNKYNISEAAFNEILQTLEISGVTLYRLQKLLGNIVPFKPTLVNCCINSCVAFTGELVDKNRCPECNEPRYNFSKTSRVSRKNAAYWSIIKYLGGNQIGNIFDGLHYKSLVSSGPKAPKNFNSFLQPLVDELKQLQEGIQCVDGIIGKTFTLRAHVLSWSGDIPALAKVMYTTGYNSYKACRFCNIHGVCCKENRHIYFPLKPPRNILGCQYDPKNLPLRTHKDYLVDISAIEHSNRSLRKCEVQERDSFPVDIMHGLFENIAPAMLRHWVGSFFKDNQISNSDYVISNNVWTEIGNKMEKNRRSMPLSFGRPPINIQRHSAAFKAEHWLNWITLYSIPLLQNNLPERYLNEWAKFVHAVKLCLKYKISIAELTEIERLFCEFVVHYEKEYLQNDSRWLLAALISYHYLLHIAASIRNTGPAWSTWQYPMERLCGMLLPLLFARNLEETPYHVESHGFIIEDAEEKLYSLSSSYQMNKTEIQRLKAYYATALNKPINLLKSITNSVQKYGKLQTKQGLIINSRLSNRKGDVARINFCIAAKLLVDRNAHYKNAPIVLEMQEFFGEACYFFSHQYDDQWSMLAYVQWVRNPHLSKHGILKFRDLGSFEVINVNAIDRNVGFLKLSNNEIYIIDKENQ